VRHCSRISEPMKPVAPVRTIFTILVVAVVVLVVVVSYFGVGGELEVGGKWCGRKKKGICSRSSEACGVGCKEGRR
jgi:hypothetical protein